ncbi:hypothetical protein A9K97_gp131 [Tokyovirus A1]|uniref:hypothetical protein n=1 Tax=Tokyovirus A1 TaxID=1826170 RepID=UPI0007A9683D|nr:hypothetical protein A9K97_gp131 [Tokyovirus A1]BAU80220.1 hypothetical protein [Tokyovirus A1]
MRKNLSIEWLKVFGVLGAKLKFEENTYMVGIHHENPDFYEFEKDVELTVGVYGVSIFFIDKDGDRVSVKDDISLLYCLLGWDMKRSLSFFARTRKIYFVKKYIHQQSSRTALFR